MKYLKIECFIEDEDFERYGWCCQIPAYPNDEFLQIPMAYHPSVSITFDKTKEELAEAHERIRELEGGLNDCEVREEWNK